MKTKKLSIMIIMIVSLNILMIAAASAEENKEEPIIRTDTIDLDQNAEIGERADILPPREDEEPLIIAPNPEETDIPENLVKSDGDGDVHILGNTEESTDQLKAGTTEQNIIMEYGVPTAAFFVVGAIIVALIILKKKQ